MPQLKNSPFTLTQFNIDEFNIKREQVKEGKPEFNFNPFGYIDYENQSYILTINFEAKDSNQAYDIKCRCIGYFRFKVEDNDKIGLGNYFYLNAPAIVYPYIRAYIASVTALSGLPAVHLPTINFAKQIADTLKKNTTTSDDVLEVKKVKKVAVARKVKPN